jgi:8-amino-7-oxononanoate synthase
MAFDFIQSELQQRRQNSLIRRRYCVDSSIGALIEIDGQHFLNFSSNDYLGMRQSEVVMQAWLNGICQYGAGSGASSLVTGYSKAHRQLEEYLCEGLQRDGVLLFNSGFAANQAICQALLNRHTNVLADKLIHASFIDGALASDATLRRFKHNDLDHLQSLMRDNHGDTLIATEGVFSMDGNRGDLLGLQAIAQQNNAWLMLDDAHGLGVLGETGMGSVEQYQLTQKQLPIMMGTFGKAIGTAGAFIAASHDVIEYMLNYARHYIYSTAMPPAQALATLASLQEIRSPRQRQKLTANIRLFKSLCEQHGIQLLPSDTAIQPVLVGDPTSTLQASEKLKSLGLWVAAIRSPTVPKGTDRLRITLSASHTEQDLQALVDGLTLVFNGMNKHV